MVGKVKSVVARTGHGAGKGTPHIEVRPPDEQAKPVPDERPEVTAVCRRQNGTFATSEAAAAIGRRGGQVKASRVALARSLGGHLDVSSEAFRPYRRSASSFRRHHSKELAKQAGGHVGAGPNSMIASAAWQLAASRFLFDLASRTGDPATFKTASQLANDSRQNLLAAYELAVREAQARAQSTPVTSESLALRILGRGTPP